MACVVVIALRMRGQKNVRAEEEIGIHRYFSGLATRRGGAMHATRSCADGHHLRALQGSPARTRPERRCSKPAASEALSLLATHNTPRPSGTNRASMNTVVRNHCCTTEWCRPDSGERTTVGAPDDGDDAWASIVSRPCVHLAQVGVGA